MKEVFRPGCFLWLSMGKQMRIGLGKINMNVSSWFPNPIRTLVSIDEPLATFPFSCFWIVERTGSRRASRFQQAESS
jgi:hypothetical protein